MSYFVVYHGNSCLRTYYLHTTPGCCPPPPDLNLITSVAPETQLLLFACARAAVAPNHPTGAQHLHPSSLEVLRMRESVGLGRKRKLAHPSSLSALISFPALFLRATQSGLRDVLILYSCRRKLAKLVANHLRRHLRSSTERRGLRMGGQRRACVRACVRASKCVQMRVSAQGTEYLSPWQRRAGCVDEWWR